MLLLLPALCAGLVEVNRLSKPALQMEARLIWATNNEPPSGFKCTPLDAQSRESFYNFCRWTNYYLITSKVFSLNDDPQRLQMSERCLIKVRRVEGGKVSLRLYGENQLVSRTVASLTARGRIITGGPAENGGGWFISLRPLIAETGPDIPE